MSKYIFVTTTSSQPKTTTCSARVNYKFPFQLENDKGVDLDIIYTINANEVDSDSEVITLNTPEYDILQAYIKRIDDIKAELFSKKLSIPLIKPEKTYQKTIFNDLQEMLKTNEWIEVSTKKSCQYEKNHNENLCSYTFSKNNYLYIVNTKQENECFICSKKPEFVHETRILENP